MYGTERDVHYLECGKQYLKKIVKIVSLIENMCKYCHKSQTVLKGLGQGVMITWHDA